MAKICIDAGHGGVQCGAINKVCCYYEKDWTLDVSYRLKNLLESSGHQVLMTRTDDSDVSLMDRCRMSNKWGSDIFVAIHLNSASNITAHGCETWYYENTKTGDKLASCVQREFLAKFGNRDRGIKAGRFTTLSKTNAVSIVAEPCFICNTKDISPFWTEEGREESAKALFRGIQSFLELHL